MTFSAYTHTHRRTGTQLHTHIANCKRTSIHIRNCATCIRAKYAVLPTIENNVYMHRFGVIKYHNCACWPRIRIENAFENSYYCIFDCPRFVVYGEQKRARVSANIRVPWSGNIVCNRLPPFAITLLSNIIDLLLRIRYTSNSRIARRA